MIKDKINEIKYWSSNSYIKLLKIVQCFLSIVFYFKT